MKKNIRFDLNYAQLIFAFLLLTGLIMLTANPIMKQIQEADYGLLLVYLIPILLVLIWIYTCIKSLIETKKGSPHD